MDDISSSIAALRTAVAALEREMAGFRTSFSRATFGALARRVDALERELTPSMVQDPPRRH